MSVSNLSDNQKRVLRDYNAPLSDRPPGVDLAGIIDGVIDGVNTLESLAVSTFAKIYNGTLSITHPATTATVTIAGADGQPAVATLNTSGTSAGYVKSAVWNGSDVLTITLDAAPGSTNTVTVSYVVLDI
jgi:hypothetical protein